MLTDLNKAIRGYISKPTHVKAQIQSSFGFKTGFDLWTQEKERDEDFMKFLKWNGKLDEFKKQGLIWYNEYFGKLDKE